MDNLHGYYLEDLEVGMSDSFAKTISEADVYGFAGISGDTNPVHINEEYAATTPFGQRIAHGMLSAALISTVAGTKLPGPGAIYVDQQIKFKAPLFIGQTARAEITVKEINERRRRVLCDTNVYVGDKVIATGEATFMVDARPEA
ncbi:MULTISPECIES: MaoC family dehydratase [unclassified Marinobacterium]|jgi:3-hydroxybutyryl-CoA dehydratase|uniref:MaoC family dehydratase n=1 Tax=unclassified Marinobacterium TaxID=2644139 RepID=UPI00156841CB|nr:MULTISPECIES: MaoC family dehydratase [unclassified Marinobacterium]NRP16267.1 (R)-specific enoyl-CoA hydratase [Marinobacterium sp. xm-a-152]NRP27129.1 (R)-specific enoyl-CoA hydratase [Marinobacterium sp. xm-d-420]NRP36576.1 (R)-specific enoyl-CoA hydratase [Marinobacterium sp. xm-d-579]NRP39085.1 (R)-specific enoyl-CoA hydratase [Marinobacterium sp. xm-a-121]NRP47983.1 (R)-specific enoyl-CoA hydratase [Marinobacterium sp. xm-d-543]